MAGRNLFTADIHFDHTAIMQYCRRPFKNVQEMNNHIINNFNSYGDEDDILYVIGDLTLGKNLERLASHMRRIRMRRKILVLGNHDELKAFSYIEAGFESVHTSLEVNGRILIHDPAVATINPNKTFICGHVHTLFLKCSNTVNVGVDQFSFMPVQESTIIDIENSGQDYFKAWEDFVKWTKK